MVFGQIEQQLGNYDAALDWYERAYQAREFMLTVLSNVQPSILAKRGSRVAGYRARSRLPPLADCHSPRSTESSSSFSSASIFIVGLLTEVLLRGLPLGRIVFRKTVCSCSTNGTRYT